LAPVRLTGNYGSEVLRGVSTFKPRRLSPALFNPEFDNALRSAAASLANGSTHPVTFAAFHEIPWNLFGSLAAGRSQVGVRTPYLDNQIVALSYQAPESLRKSPAPGWQLVKANSVLLSRIPTDRRPSPDSSGLAAIARRFFSEATFKLDYVHNEGWPHWLSHYEAILGRAASGLKIIGLHKYLHYRSWFRGELADYVKDVISHARIQQAPFWNGCFLRKLASDHAEGRQNYVFEINAVLTLEAVERLLLRDAGAGRPTLDRSDAPIARPVLLEEA
jgi:asparagine synthase (glutamine-hydrolysing)